jgi:glycosyltransferase involved in cell wall biosynthesis
MQPQSNTVVYLVTGTPPNDRVSKVAQLGGQFRKLVLVRRYAPNRPADGKTMVLRAVPNPIGALRRVGLGRAAAFLDRVYFPNTAVLYAWAVERRLRREIAQDTAAGRDVCLITCAPPHAVCMAGLKLKRAFPQIRWIVDWQDLWSYDENYFLPVPKVYRARVKRVEADILRTADVNVTTNEHAKRVLEEQYRAPRVVAIPHHFKRDEFTGVQSPGVPRTRVANGPITIGFFGTLFKPPRVPGERFVDSIRRVRASGTQVELHVHGGIPPHLEGARERLARDGTVLHGRTSHTEGISLLTQYDFLLLLLADLANSQAVMSIKLPHYLLVGRPIIAVVPEQSAVADVVRETGTGVVIAAGSDWSERLRDVLGSRCAMPVRNEAAIERFAWENVSREWLAAIQPELDKRPA